MNNVFIKSFKKKENVVGIYMVVSFRDNKNKYNGSNTTSYCSLVNLDNGSLAFEERCSRSTTVRRVLNHILRLGFSTQNSLYHLTEFALIV